MSGNENDFISDDLDQSGVNEPRNSGSRFQRINFLSGSNEPRYAGTVLQTGGFQIPVRDGMYLPDDKSAFEEVSLGESGIALAAKTLEFAVIGISPQVRRYIVEVDTEKDGKPIKVAAGHIDIAPRFWREIRQTDFGRSLQAPNRQGKPVDPRSHCSMFVVMRQMPTRVWEIGLKGGNANIPREIGEQLFTLADMQTVRIGKLRGKSYQNTMGHFVNWVPFTAGATMAYARRLDGENSGGFTRLSIAWPNVSNLVKFQRNFTRMDDFGEKVNAMQELSEARKLLKDDDLGYMFVGGTNYAKFLDMAKELDEVMAQGYINPLESQTAILEAIEEVKRGYFERSIAINGRQLPPAAPADDGPRNRDEWEDAKQSLAQNPPAQAPSNGKPSKTEDKVPTLWNLDQMKEFKKGVIMGWADATEKEREVMVSHVTIQYLMRLNQPPEWRGEPDAKQVAKAIQNCIDFDDVNAPEGQIAY